MFCPGRIQFYPETCWFRFPFQSFPTQTNTPPPHLVARFPMNGFNAPGGSDPPKPRHFSWMFAAAGGGLHAGAGAAFRQMLPEIARKEPKSSHLCHSCREWPEMLAVLKMLLWWKRSRVGIKLPWVLWFMFSMRKCVKTRCRSAVGWNCASAS